MTRRIILPGLIRGSQQYFRNAQSSATFFHESPAFHEADTLRGWRNTDVSYMHLARNKIAQ